MKILTYGSSLYSGISLPERCYLNLMVNAFAIVLIKNNFPIFNIIFLYQFTMRPVFLATKLH